MTGKHQLQRSLEIDAPREAVWAILADSASLSLWAPAVQEVTSSVAGPEEVGSVRECRVDFAGRLRSGEFSSPRGGIKPPLGQTNPRVQ